MSVHFGALHVCIIIIIVVYYSITSRHGTTLVRAGMDLHLLCFIKITVKKNWRNFDTN